MSLLQLSADTDVIKNGKLAAVHDAALAVRAEFLSAVGGVGNPIPAGHSPRGQLDVVATSIPSIIEQADFILGGIADIAGGDNKNLKQLSDLLAAAELENVDTASDGRTRHG